MKNIIITIIVIVAVAGLGYLGLTYVGGSADTLVGATPDSSNAILTALNTLEGIHLNVGFFNDPVYLSLQDFTQQITPEPLSRPNPFAPYTGYVAGTGSASVSNAAAVTAPASSDTSLQAGSSAQGSLRPGR
jgi:hypothetical protein